MKYLWILVVFHFMISSAWGETAITGNLATTTTSTSGTKSLDSATARAWHDQDVEQYNKAIEEASSLGPFENMVRDMAKKNPHYYQDPVMPPPQDLQGQLLREQWDSAQKVQSWEPPPSQEKYQTPHF